MRISMVLCLALLSTAAYGQSLRERLVGTWMLVSWGILSGDVEVPMPMGKGAAGIITYSPDGYMCVNIMAPNRPKFASLDFMGGSVNAHAADQLVSQLDGHPPETLHRNDRESHKAHCTAGPFRRQTSRRRPRLGAAEVRHATLPPDNSL